MHQLYFLKIPHYLQILDILCSFFDFDLIGENVNTSMLGTRERVALSHPEGEIELGVPAIFECRYFGFSSVSRVNRDLPGYLVQVDAILDARQKGAFGVEKGFSTERLLLPVKLGIGNRFPLLLVKWKFVMVVDVERGEFGFADQLVIEFAEHFALGKVKVFIPSTTVEEIKFIDVGLQLLATHQ